MIVNSILKKEADLFFNKISINDFYSYTKSDFKNSVLADLTYEKSLKDINECDSFIRYVNILKKSLDLSTDDIVISKALIEFCNYIKRDNKFYWNKFCVTHNTSPLPYIIKALESCPFDTANDMDRYLILIESLPELVRVMMDKLKKQKEMNILLPYDECKISVSMLRGLYQSGSSKLHRDTHRSQIDKAIASYNIELKRMIDYLTIDYIDGCSHKTGIQGQKNGEEYYQSLIKTYTSYDYTPEKINEIGLNNIEITKDKMRGIIKSLGFNMTIETFNKCLENEKRFFDKTPNDLHKRMNCFLEKIKPKLKDYFNKIPETECEVRRIDPSREASTSWGYYAIPVGTEKKGIYYFSGAELDKRCQIRSGAIVYHELLPGHHFQMSLIDEDKNLPLLCRQHFNTAYADGWAEYAADLTGEMGMYDEYDLYGRYLWDLVLSTRLVADTGVNALGWSLKKVQDFMFENTTLTESEIYTESLRYSADMPGQALAYKMGSLKMHEFRDNAERKLGSGFNLKDYHDSILKYGSIPLNLVEENVNRYIQTVI